MDAAKLPMNTYKLEVILTDTKLPFYSLQELEKEIVRVFRNELLLRIDSMNLRTHQL